MSVLTVATNRVYRVDALPTFVPFPFHPVSIEIREQSVDIVCARGVPLPLASIVLQERLVLECVRFLGSRVS